MLCSSVDAEPRTSGFIWRSAPEFSASLFGKGSEDAVDEPGDSALPYTFAISTASSMADATGTCFTPSFAHCYPHNVPVGGRHPAHRPALLATLYGPVDCALLEATPLTSSAGICRSAALQLQVS